jgi:hypothetical protein
MTMPPELPIDGEVLTLTAERTTIDAKPAAGVFTGAVTVLGLSLLNRYTSYQPTIEEATSITVIVSGLSMWLIPSTIRRKLDGDQGE